MSPRTLTAAGKDAFKHVAKMERRAREQAERDGAEMAVVEFDGLVFIRPLARAQHLVEKHRREGAKILSKWAPSGDPA